MNPQEATQPMARGRCLCGDVTFTIATRPQDPAACHCRECRRQSGHVWAAASVPDATLVVAGRVEWYSASARARRGFCPRCGSFLFWKAVGTDRTDVAMGALDAPTGLRLARNIFATEKGDYYDITDGLPQQRGQD
jgi:hypothetical protein